jgi:hypothetical protein
MKNQFLSSFEEACARLNMSSELPDVSKWPERLQKHLIALHKLDTILQVNNDGWVADLADIGQTKWYPYFWVTKDSNAPGGFRLAYYGCDYGSVTSHLGVRLACQSRDLAIFMGQECADLYKDLHS